MTGNKEFKKGDIVRYAPGQTGLAMLEDPHCNGWLAKHCMGGMLFVYKVEKATECDIYEAKKSRFWSLG